jgi:hypothetical protein
MSRIGILAYGSLISDPGSEISKYISDEIQTMTPFPVEYVRVSRTRGDAPTVAPHSSGKPVRAKLLVLQDGIVLEDAKSLLWRRETRNEGLDREYQMSSSPYAIVVSDLPGFCGLDHVLYTDFNESGKLSHPIPGELARAAVDSVMKSPDGKDGISYLMDLINVGVDTELTPAYQKELLVLTGASDLGEALALVKSKAKDG